MRPRDSCRNIFKDVGILTLPGTFIYECLSYTRANLENTSLNSDYHDYNTRLKGSIRPIGHRLTKMSKSFLCMGVRLFNKLPESLRQLEYIEFRREVKKYVVGKEFYTIDEMLSGTAGSHLVS